jgi:hypothetical protein
VSGIAMSQAGDHLVHILGITLPTMVGLRGGAEGIRTDGHRGFPPANRRISPVNLKGDERQTRLRKATQS